MTAKVYTFGYGGIPAAVLAQMLDLLDADLFDIRYSAGSMNPDYSGKRLAERLGFRYNHIRPLGNENYKRDNAPIKIMDYAAGLIAIQCNPKPVVLMCACREYDSCHRHTVSQMLAKDGIVTEEVTREWLVEQGLIQPPKQKKATKKDQGQLPLFGKE